MRYNPHSLSFCRVLTYTFDFDNLHMKWICTQIFDYRCNTILDDYRQRAELPCNTVSILILQIAYSCEKHSNVFSVHSLQICMYFPNLVQDWEGLRSALGDGVGKPLWNSSAVKSSALPLQWLQEWLLSLELDTETKSIFVLGCRNDSERRHPAYLRPCTEHRTRNQSNSYPVPARFQERCKELPLRRPPVKVHYSRVRFKSRRYTWLQSIGHAFYATPRHQPN